MPSVLSRVITDGFIPSVMFPREKNFWHARIRLYYRRWVVFFLFATELTTEMGFTDDCFTDGSVPSVSPSVLFSPTDCIAFTDGIIPSVKLDNVVVIFLITLFMNSWLIRILCHMQWILILNENAVKYSFAWTGYNIQVNRHQTVSYLPCHRQDLNSRPLPTPLFDKNISSI